MNGLRRKILIGLYSLLDVNYFFFFCSAGRTTTNEELEEMLEQGNPAVFTQGVSLHYL